MIDETLLISCPGADGGLFMLRGETCVRLSNRATTGLSVSKSQLIFAYQGDDGKSVRVVKDGRTEVIVLDDNRLDLHDVLVVDDKVYLVTTETNSVVCLDDKFKRVDSWSLPGENDSSHLNSVAFYDGRLLASAFGRFKQHREYKQGTLGRGKIIDIHAGETFIDGLSQPHSLTVFEDLLYICCSEEKKVRIYRKKKLLQKIEVPGYPRGLAVSGANLYVGISLSRNTESNDDDVNSAVIIVLDRTTMQLKTRFSLPCREIYDVRIVKDVTGFFPYLLVDLVEEKAKIEELSALYQRGYESFKRAHDCLTLELEHSKQTQLSLALELEHSKQAQLSLALELESSKQAQLSLAQELEKIKRSTFWQLTRPVRYISKFIKWKD